LVYWSESTVEIKANARVSVYADCGDDDCVECDSKKNCLTCRSGMLPQGKKCVDSCEEGYWKNKVKCDLCESDCAKCKNGVDCQKCKGSKVLKKGDCLSECGKDYEAKSGVCKLKGFGSKLITVTA